MFFIFNSGPVVVGEREQERWGVHHTLDSGDSLIVTPFAPLHSAAVRRGLPPTSPTKKKFAILFFFSPHEISHLGFV